MNPKSGNCQNESKVLRFSEIPKGSLHNIPKERVGMPKESRIVGIEDQAKRQLTKKIIEKGKSF
jgi:hypothetical protein